MAVSNDLLAQFAKVVKEDKSTTKKESIVYGTIQISNDLPFVLIDGATEPIPISISSSGKPGTVTSDVKNGDRVTVMIKNHAVTITGNASDPAPSSSWVEFNMRQLGNQVDEFENIIADTVTTEVFDAEIARIDEVIADVITTESLEAFEAEITNLKAEDVTIKNQLTAQSASIESLETNKLDAATADIEFAKIDTLESEVGDINTLIFGSATGSTIQTSFANAVIAQLGNAQIKSAMIESVSADKITAGDIITNNVRVMSEDGKLLISDETIQISDDTRVRVQIGKDAENDYSINIWDANGKLMFSEGGITDSAIKEAIIRNDMVSDTANIAAHKLDIDSLFEEINGSSKTIKSSRVYLDDQKQSLDVAFESVTTDIEELQNGMSSQGTQITAIQGQIASKVWKTDIDSAVDAVDTKTDNLSTQYTELEQDLNSISTTVASHTSQISKKADSSTVTTVSDKVTKLETDVDSFKSTVSSVESEVSDLDTRVTSAESSVTQLSNKIATNVTETTNLGKRMTAVEQTADDLTVRLDTAEDDITTAQSTANTAKTNAATAQTTANAAKKQLYHSASGTSGTTGYVGICKLTVKGNYVNRPVLFELNNRGTQSSNVSLRFSNNSGTDPGLDRLQYDGSIGVWAYKVDTSTWHLIAQKSEGYDTIYVKDFANHNGNLTVEWINVHYSSLPTSNITAGTLLAAKIAKSVVDNAAKTATNYLNFSNSGLVVGNHTASSLGKNVLIDSDSVDIRNGTTTLASFGGETITLGQNAENSSIDLCDGAGTISTRTSEASTSWPKRNAILIDSQEIETESLRFVASTSNAYGETTTPTVQRGTELYMLRSAGSSESCARLKAEHKTTSSGAYTNSGISAMTYDAASTTRAMVYASDSANSQYNQVNVYPTKTTMNKNLVLNGTTYTGKNKVLWSGGWYMSAAHTATLSEAISAQANGVVFIWSQYVDSTVDNSSFNMTYLPKHFVTLHAGKGITMILATGTMNIIASKYLYISDTSVTGYASNDDVATNKDPGIISTTSRFVLRYIIGV